MRLESKTNLSASLYSVMESMVSLNFGMWHAAAWFTLVYFLVPEHWSWLSSIIIFACTIRISFWATVNGSPFLSSFIILLLNSWILIVDFEDGLTNSSITNLVLVRSFYIGWVCLYLDLWADRLPAVVISSICTFKHDNVSSTTSLSTSCSSR